MSDAPQVLALSSLQELSRILRRERDVLGLVLDRLDGGALDDARDLLRSLASVELHRAITSREVARELGLPADATLPDMLAAMTGPWRRAFADHRAAIADLLDAVRRAVTPDVIDLRDGAPTVVQRSLVDWLG